jgi:hypothetical protein
MLARGLGQLRQSSQARNGIRDALIVANIWRIKGDVRTARYVVGRSAAVSRFAMSCAFTLNV